MKLCKIKPTQEECIECHINHMKLYCDSRPLNKNYQRYKFRKDVKEYEILDFAVDRKNNGYAMVLIDGNVEMVSIDRLYDVRTVKR